MFFDTRLLTRMNEVIDAAFGEFTGETAQFCTRCGARINRADGVCDECGFQPESEIVAEISKI